MDLALLIAAGVAARRREAQMIAINLVLITLAVFVAVGRFAGWGE